MALLSSQKADEFADDLNTIAVAIGNVRQGGVSGDGQLLTSQQKDYLLNCQIQLLRSSATFSAMAITLNADAIQDQLNHLQTATQSIDQTLARIKDIQKIMDIGAAAVNVVSSVATGNVLSVGESMGKLLAKI